MIKSSLLLVKNLAKAAMAVLGGPVGIGGALLVDMAEDWYDGAKQKASEDDLREEIEQIAQMKDDEYAAHVEAAVEEVAADAPPAQQDRLRTLLTVWPETIRRTLSRPQDPRGNTVPPGLSIAGPRDLMQFLPTAIPRFARGERPEGLGNRELVRCLGIGGFGEVWLARNPDFPGFPPTVLKFCREDREAQSVLRHEAHVLARVMEHQNRVQNIVQLKDTYLHLDPPCLEYEAPDPRDDVFALGVIWYQMLMGDVAAEITSDWAEELEEAGIELPDGQLALLKSCLRGRRERRPANAAIVAEELRSLVDEALSTPEAEARPKAPQPRRSAARARLSFEGQEAGEVRTFGDLKIKMCWCPSGTFIMGSPKSENDRHDDEDQVTVKLTRGFWMGRTEVTQGVWKSVMGTQPWKGEEYVKEGANYAATYVDHTDAVSFCEKLTSRERKAGRLPVGWSYRLPTEAEWEYACRARTKTAYSFGDDAAKLGDYAWYAKNAWDIDEKYAHTVASKKPNAWGLYDMHGNVWEWCQDWYDQKLAGGTDSQGSEKGSYRVLRGGCWSSSPRRCRSACRPGRSPSYRLNFLGSRVVLSSR